MGAGVFGISKILGIVLQYFGVTAGKTFWDFIFYIARPAQAFEFALSVIIVIICALVWAKYLIKLSKSEKRPSNFHEKI